MTETLADFYPEGDNALRNLIDAEHDANHNGTTTAGSFQDRVTNRQVDLIQRIQDGIPPADYLPASEHMLRRGKRHHWAAPKKVGKSLSGQVHATDIVLAGGRVVIFDRENGGDLYAARLEAIIQGRPLDTEAQEQIKTGLAYFEFPRFHKDDGPELALLCLNADLVIFDSQRMYLSDLGLEENSSDDYAEFMAALIDPLFQAGIATLILDNTGHGEPRRGRGASSKGDLNEILFVLETVERFGLDLQGRVRLEITDSRFGNAGRWDMELGAGHFGSWQRVDHTVELIVSAFRFTGKMERCSIYVENCVDPVSRNTVTDAIGGKAQPTRSAIDSLVREGYFRSIDGPRGAKLVESLKPYREATDPLHDAPVERPDPSPVDNFSADNKNEVIHSDRVPDRVPPNESDRVPDRVPPKSPNHAGLPTASHRVPTASPTASPDRVPDVVFPYGEPTTASPAKNQPRPEPKLPFTGDDDIPF